MQLKSPVRSLTNVDGNGNENGQKVVGLGYIIKLLLVIINAL